MTIKKLMRSPLYEQLAVLLVELVKSDEFKMGDKFLSERQICDRFDVSRATANKAVSALIQEQILEFRKGVGNFIINQSSVDRHVHEHLSFTNKTLALGKRPSTKVVEFRETNAKSIPVYIRDKMEATDQESITVVRRIRYADGKPVIAECHYFRNSYFETPITEEEVGVSVYDAITKNHGISLVRMDEVIRTIILSGDTLALFGEENDLPGFLMNFMPFTSENVPLYFAEVLYRGDFFEFHNRIGPIQASRKARGAVSFI
ncbi:MAG: GntR family transcriptional regulator [Spirochaetales bacterium]|nr:GntR family transcriptional regulator [Spirochaetales bacterium]